MNKPLVVVSVVSHNQGNLVRDLLRDIDAKCDGNVRIILTLNVPEVLQFEPKDCRHPVEIVRNERPRGFGSNHNNAFRRVSGDYFCVANPDIRFSADPFEKLERCLTDSDAALAGPLVTSPQGEREDSARRFPTPFRIAKKLFQSGMTLDYSVTNQLLRPDWIGGMFMFFRSAIFRECRGFDERYFLYYEDVDLCARLRLAGRDIVMCPGAIVMHAARRESRRDFKYLRWHLTSMLRFFFSAVFFRLAVRGFLTRRLVSG